MASGYTINAGLCAAVLSGLTPGDIVTCQFTRYGAASADTFAGDAFFVGFEVYE